MAEKPATSISEPPTIREIICMQVVKSNLGKIQVVWNVTEPKMTVLVSGQSRL